ncbi:MAG TPA: HAD family hydrolase [Solirubrobacteraceae bacterium]|jgi:putative hydrolase of the HAD superfamily|nr:HAD family hydrolase [Solirubrobacteraceae bacterium]
MHDPAAPNATASGPEALLIDALGTLVSLSPPAPALAGALARRLGLEVAVADADRALRAEIAYYRAHMGEGRDARSLADLRRRCAQELRRTLPADPRLAALDGDAMTDLLLSALRFEAYADAREALRRARRAGARIIVVSNWDVSLLEVLELVGLAPLLHGVVTSAAVGAAKPAPEIFDHALALAGVQAGRALHVGDSLTEDVDGARECGIPALLLRRDGGAGQAAPAGVATITSLDELVWP